RPPPPRRRIALSSCSASRASSEWKCRRNAFGRRRLDQVNANEDAERAAGRQGIEDGPFGGPSRVMSGIPFLPVAKAKPRNCSWTSRRSGATLLRLAESALNDVGRGVRGLDNICGAEHEQCTQERWRMIPG